MTDEKAQKQNWLSHLLRGVIRFCLRQGLTIQDIVETSKKVIVDTASEEIRSSGESVNVSRLSLLTGLHRRDVGRILKGEKPLGAANNFIARIITQWEQDKRFKNKTGKPKALNYVGENSSFKKLVRAVSADISPATVLFELKRIGAVKETTNGNLELISNVYTVDKDASAGFEFTAKDIDYLLCAVEENLLSPDGTANLHARTEYDNIYKSDLPKIKKWLLREGSIFHKRVRDYLASFDKDINPSKGKEGGGKVVIGAYSLTEKS